MGVLVAVTVEVLVAVTVGVLVAVTVGVLVAVTVGVLVAVTVGVPVALLGDAISVVCVLGRMVITLGGAVVTVGVDNKSPVRPTGPGRNCSAANPIT